MYMEAVHLPATLSSRQHVPHDGMYQMNTHNVVECSEALYIHILTVPTGRYTWENVILKCVCRSIHYSELFLL